MHFAMHPEDLVAEESRRRAAVRGGVAEARSARRAAGGRGGRISAFRIWRLHVMVWIEGGRAS